MITVTAATGHLGRLAVAALLERGVPAGELVAAVRRPQQAADLAALGVQLRHADYDDPASLSTALAGTERLLFISGSEVGKRVPQHAAVIDAAVAAGVSLLVYTSILKADSTGIPLAAEHKATEERIAASGLRHALLRNSWYTENYTANLAPVLDSGLLFGAADDGPVGAAPRADYAAAAAAVVVDGRDGVFELAADEPFTMAQLAEELTRQTGTKVEYRNLPEDEYAQVLIGAGLPEGYARSLAAADRGIARGELATDTRDLSRLTGRPTTPLADAIAAALRA